MKWAASACLSACPSVCLHVWCPDRGLAPDQLSRLSNGLAGPLGLLKSAMQEGFLLIRDLKSQDNFLSNNILAA